MPVDNEILDGFPAYDHAKDFYARYDVKEVLGRGVSSTVRRCREKATGKDYAVKVCDLTIGLNDGAGDAHNVVETAKNEVNILRMCSQQKHIIGIQEAFDSNTYMFVILELCPKGELFDYLTEVVALNEKQTRQLMVQLFQAVEFLHSRNIVHRDIKPENILLASDMNIKLSDFGFAAVVEHDEQLTELLGTPGYLSPEVLKVSMYDNMPGYGRPVDMWACGVIMYTLLAGFPPFWHRKQVYMLRAITEGKYNFTSPEWDDISTQAKDLITKLLVVDPRQRLTASEALAHPFCRREDEVIKRRLSAVESTDQESETKMKRTSFKVGALVVIAVHRLNQLRLRPVDTRLPTIRSDPYRFRLARKIVDAAAFKMYGHWVQRSNDQNRAALFANAIKRDVINSCKAAAAVQMANNSIDVSSGACADVANNATAAVVGLSKHHSSSSLSNEMTRITGLAAV